MKYKEAKKQFRHALDHQQTISIPKLRKLMQSMNIGLEPRTNVEIEYLKSEIKKLNKRLKKRGE